jgi:hypothetical protein
MELSSEQRVALLLADPYRLDESSRAEQRALRTHLQRPVSVTEVPTRDLLEAFPRDVAPAELARRNKVAGA